MALSNGLTETRSYNARLQTTGIPLGSTLNLGLYYCPSQGTSCSTNNGNVASITIAGSGVSSQITQGFGYDGFNRLNSFTETGGTANQNYGYDNYRNRWVSSGWVNPAYSPQTPQSNVFTNNRWVPSSVGYDAAGNQTSVPVGAGTRSFTYDGERRIVAATIPGMSALAGLRTSRSPMCSGLPESPFSYLQWASEDCFASRG